MRRPIVAFRTDDAGDWVAELSCGHPQHTRHDPPLSERPWVLSAAGRASRIGTELDCVRCDRSEMPLGHAPYRRTPEFDESSVPDALLREHATKRGVWGRIHVVRGALEYHVHAPFHRSERLTPEAPGTVLPEVEHHVAVSGPVAFFVEFWRASGERPGA